MHPARCDDVISISSSARSTPPASPMSDVEPCTDDSTWMDPWITDQTTELDDQWINELNDYDGDQLIDRHIADV